MHGCRETGLNPAILEKKKIPIKHKKKKKKEIMPAVTGAKTHRRESPFTGHTRTPVKQTDMLTTGERQREGMGECVYER